MTESNQVNVWPGLDEVLERVRSDLLVLKLKATTEPFIKPALSCWIQAKSCLFHYRREKKKGKVG